MNLHQRSSKWPLLLANSFLWVTTLTIYGHEGHAPLPTKGLRVEGDRIVLSQAATKALGVQTAKVELRDLEKTVRAHAAVVTRLGHLAYATALVGGTIVDVIAKPGDRVEAGQALARVQSAELELLQLEVLQSAEELVLAERLLLDRQKVGESISGRVLLETRATRDQKVTQRAIARQKLVSLGFSTERIAAVENEHKSVTTLPISSPISGTIAEADVRVGQVVAPTEHLDHIVDRSRVWVVGDVIETQSAGLANDQPVRCHFESVPGWVFHGQLNFVGVRFSDERRTLAATATLDNEDGTLRSGQFGRMEIVVDQRKQCVVCPAQAVYRIGGQDYVLVDDGPNKYVRRRIKIGLRAAKEFEVTNGLFPGDRVVTVGRQELAAAFGISLRSEAMTTSTGHPSGSPSAEVVVATGRVVLPTDAKSYAASTVEGRVAEIKVLPSQRVV